MPTRPYMKAMSAPRTPGQRPKHVIAPAYLGKSPPVPAPKAAPRAPEPDPERLDPVRYGDWEISGIAVDF